MSKLIETKKKHCVDVGHRLVEYMYEEFRSPSSVSSFSEWLGRVRWT